MSLHDDQVQFARLIPRLIDFIFAHPGYAARFGDFWAHDGHVKNSRHYDRLAADILIDKDGVYLTETEDYRFAGEYWKSLHPKCTWGGDFFKKDGNHFSWNEGKQL